MMRCAAVVFVLLSITNVSFADDYEKARRAMVAEAIVGAGVKDERVVRAMTQTPRHEFVAVKHRRHAYFDMSLPIGDSQTISSPFTVAFMTESIDPQPSDRVLEIGTGSGYQAAILSPLVKEVYSIEIVKDLGERAARTLKRLAYTNVKTKIGDGYKGWKEHAPFDKIIVTCSPESVPQPLIDQLKEGGLMVIPVGTRYSQTLYLMKKEGGKLKQQSLRPSLFVPMTGDAEASRKDQPDPTKPQVQNGGFEGETNKFGFLPVWYYQRQVEQIKSEEAPEGKAFASLRNETPGRKSHLLQGIAIDGSKIKTVRLSADVRAEGIKNGPNAIDVPLIQITFYDHDRKPLGASWLGPFRSRDGWKNESRSIDIPTATREAILQIGLNGATGRLDVDNVKLIPAPLTSD